MTDRPQIQSISEEALAWLKSLGQDIDEGQAEKLSQSIASDEYEVATIASALMIGDLAKSMLRSVAYAIRTGKIPAKFDRDDGLGLVTTGISQYDPRVAFQATTRTAYQAGKIDRGMKSALPYFRYITMRDNRVRPEHAVLDGVTLPKDDAFWQAPHSHLPPLGWRCRCQISTIDDAGVDDLKRAGQPVQEEAPEEEMVTYTDNITGKEVSQPASIEPGWGFDPRDEKRQLADILKNRLLQALKASAAVEAA